MTSTSIIQSLKKGNLRSRITSAPDSQRWDCLNSLNRVYQGTLFFLIILIVSGCRQEPGQIRATPNIRLTDKRLIRYNQVKVKTEDRFIDDFLQRYQWEMQTSGTGLRYLIYQKGEGRAAEKDLLITIHYQVRLLNGDLLYSSDSAGDKQVWLGHSSEEPGLDEGLMMMREGDKAKLIIPSYLAYGMIGDQKKIPPGASLVYDIEIVSVKEPDIP